MKLKKFGEFINEDTASGYNIEKPFTGDGDDLSTQDDETTDLHDDEFHSDIDDTEDSEEDGISDIKKLAIAKIIAGEISDEKIEALLSDSDSLEDETEDGEIEDIIEDDMDEEDEDMHDEEGEENHFFPKMSLEESLKFKNFIKRK